MPFFVVVLKLSVSAGLILWLMHESDISHIFDLFMKLNWIDFLLIFSVLILGILVASVRWNKVLKVLKMDVSYLESIKLLWIGLFFGQAMPSSVGGDLFKGYYLKQKGYTLKNTAIAVLLDRIFGLFALIVVVILLLPLLFSIISEPVARWSVVSIIPFAAIGISSLFLLERAPSFISALKLVKKMINFIAECRILIFSKNTSFSLLLLSILIHVISIVSIIVISQSLFDQIPVVGLMLVMPLVILFMALPISIAGWGVREGVMVVGLSYVGVSSDTALAISLLYGFSLLLVSIPGLVFWLLRK